MTEAITRFDELLKDNGPAAAVLRQHLMPVEGHDGVLFPATFAASEDRVFRGGYNIDEFADGRNVCLVDSVGSQANRIEPLFAQSNYRDLVPQVTIRFSSDRAMNLLDAGHRAADALVRCSALREQLQSAFLSILRGNAEPLARIAPTSLVFGAWDSRDTQAKLPRLLAATIRAYDVRRLTRSAQYVPATDYVLEQLLDEPSDEKTRKAHAERGFAHVPSSGTPGGVVATGGILRDVTLHLSALRQLVGESPEQTLALQRYTLGLALVAFTYPTDGYLRQGCNLVLDPDKRSDCVIVFGDGRREPFQITHDDAIRYARAAAAAFGRGGDLDVEFDRTVAASEVSDSGIGKKAKRTAKAK